MNKEIEDKILDILHEYDCSSPERYERIMSMFDELLQEDWINVSDELPKEVVEKVLVYTIHKNILIGYLDKRKEWRYVADDRGITVTHWQEIKPPITNKRGGCNP